MNDILWRPSPERIAGSPLRAYLDWLQQREGREFTDHDALWAWSVADVDRFWNSVVDYYDVMLEPRARQVRTTDPMPYVRWFPGARLNWAEHALRRGTGPTLSCLTEGGGEVRTIDHDVARRQVGSAAAWLRRAGVRPGDRVVAYLPNTEHAVIGCLAAAAVGAVWSCCSPDFGADGTISRLAQLEPTVLLATDGYHWNGRTVDRADVVAALRAHLPTVQRFVHVPYAFPDRAAPRDATPWEDVVGGEDPPAFEPVEFSHPLWVQFSSGTTGRPKGLVHGHGGMTLQGLMWSGLYCGLRPGERMFAVTSTGWTLWNMQLGALMQGATIVLYEGSPGFPAGAVWEAAARIGADVVLLGAAVVTASAAAGVVPRIAFDLRRLRHLMVSGSSLPADEYRWVAANVGADVRIDSTSGGTDISGAFLGASEYDPVRVGRIGGRLAGVDAAAWDADGEPVVDVVGDLVVTQPLPSMPVFFWDDPDRARYAETYFEPWPGTWRHGDWVEFHSDGGVSMHGRSDSTLNRQGVRLGTAEFYDVLDSLPDLAETLVVGVDEPGGGYWLGLFVVPAPGVEVDDVLRARLGSVLRDRLTPRHVPDEIVAAPGVPHTLSGKKLEIPVKRLLAGIPIGAAATVSAVDDPELLRWYARFAAARLASG